MDLHPRAIVGDMCFDYICDDKTFAYLNRKFDGGGRKATTDEGR